MTRGGAVKQVNKKNNANEKKVVQTKAEIVSNQATIAQVENKIGIATTLQFSHLMKKTESKQFS
jgi:hypothetical protein